MLTTDNMVLFWRTADIYSNWHPSPFMLDGVKYLNVEQCMMAEKARLFGDEDALESIMLSKDPSQIKAAGRRVQGYDDALWSAYREDVIYHACYEKFKQNPTLLTQLLATNDKELVEASPVDVIWGIGLAEDDPRALDKTQWRGQNLLGKALMSARDMLRRRDDFAKWYHQEVGISLDEAKRREVYDLDLIESAWLAGYKFAAAPLTDADIEAVMEPCEGSAFAEHLRREFVKSFKRVYFKLHPERAHGIGAQESKHESNLPFL